MLPPLTSARSPPRAVPSRASLTSQQLVGASHVELPRADETQEEGAVPSVHLLGHRPGQLLPRGRLGPHQLPQLPHHLLPGLLPLVQLVLGLEGGWGGAPSHRRAVGPVGLTNESLTSARPAEALAEGLQLGPWVSAYICPGRSSACQLAFGEK